MFFILIYKMQGIEKRSNKVRDDEITSVYQNILRVLSTQVTYLLYFFFSYQIPLSKWSQKRINETIQNKKNYEIEHAFDPSECIRELPG